LNVFAISSDLDVCTRKSVEIGVFFEGVGYFERDVQTEGGVTHQPLLVLENHSACPLVCYQNIRSAMFSFVTR